MPHLRAGVLRGFITMVVCTGRDSRPLPTGCLPQEHAADREGLWCLHLSDRQSSSPPSKQVQKLKVAQHLGRLFKGKAFDERSTCRRMTCGLLPSSSAPAGHPHGCYMVFCVW